MNHVTQLNRLTKLQKAYQDFLPFCPPNKSSTLLLEIHKLDLRIKKINTMNLEKSLIEVPFWFETKQSKLNFSTHH
jgi:hypothetical protein